MHPLDDMKGPRVQEPEHGMVFTVLVPRRFCECSIDMEIKKKNVLFRFDKRAISLNIFFGTQHTYLK